MSPIWTRTQYIMLILSAHFPDGVTSLIVDFMKELEFEDSRKEHENDCILFRAKHIIGDVVDECKGVSPDFLNKTLRHVDYHIQNMKFHREFKSCIPRLGQFQIYENKDSIINRYNEQNIPAHFSWQRDCFAFKILDKAKIRKSRSFLDCLNIFFQFDRYCLGANHYVESYNNNSSVIRINDYVDRDTFVRKLKRKRQKNSMKIPKDYKGSVYSWMMYGEETYKRNKKQGKNQRKYLNRCQKYMKKKEKHNKYMFKKNNRKMRRRYQFNFQ